MGSSERESFWNSFIIRPCAAPLELFVCLTVSAGLSTRSAYLSKTPRAEPEELVESLNYYLAAMTEIVFKHGGTLDKYVGDAIMVFFGDPVPIDDHAERAVKMALEMQEKLLELQHQWSMQIEEPLNVGMGIATGYVTVGNIGSLARMEYTVLGNYVNLAARLADQAEPGQILISDRTLARV